MIARGFSAIRRRFSRPVTRLLGGFPAHRRRVSRPVIITLDFGDNYAIPHPRTGFVAHVFHVKPSGCFQPMAGFPNAFTVGVSTPLVHPAALVTPARPPPVREFILSQERAGVAKS